MTRKTPLISQLKTRRQILGWSLKEAGERCGIDESFLDDWERGIGSPQLETLETWATGLGLTLTLACGEEGAHHRPSHGINIDWDVRGISVDGNSVRLTPMEWKALERLAWKPGELVTHQALFRHLYGDQRTYRTESTAVRVLITKLRRLLPIRIEAQWGRGYVISGVEASLPQERRDLTGDGEGRRGSAPAAEPTRRDHAPSAPHLPPLLPPRGPARLHRDFQPATARGAAAAAAVQLNPCRAEELGIIERFLAERGATRCPDLATIQKSPLPTLVWDKVKRKWVRPSTADLKAS